MTAAFSTVAFALLPRDQDSVEQIESAESGT